MDPVVGDLEKDSFLAQAKLTLDEEICCQIPLRQEAATRILRNSGTKRKAVLARLVCMVMEEKVSITNIECDFVPDIYWCASERDERPCAAVSVPAIPANERIRIYFRESFGKAA